MKISKYEFNSKEQAQTKIADLEEGHQHTIVELGHITTSPAVYDEEGNEVSPAIYSDKYHVDVLWQGIDSHPYGWATYAINLNNEGSHSFFGVSYLDNKI